MKHINRYQRTFNACKESGSTAFVAFAVAGDPNPKISEAVLKAYVDAGADILEIGYPFSDPIADGPVNQRAAIRSIEAGFSPAEFFKLIRSVRSYTDIPIGVLMYANSAHHLGYDTFCKRASQAGVDSILIADMPPEEAEELLAALNKYAMQSVFIVSELTPPDRMRLICSKVTGFVYVVSRLGSTGVQTAMDNHFAETLDKLKEVTDKPLCVGFGISTPAHVKNVKMAGADGAIVGSALVKIVEDNLDNPKKMVTALKKSVQAFKVAARELLLL